MSHPPVGPMGVSAPLQLATCAGAFLLPICGVGCSKSVSSSVSPENAASAAMAQLDGNQDGALDDEELTKCPPLSPKTCSFDANQDGRLSRDELTAGFKQIYAPGKSLTEVTCSVTLDGRPLSDATLHLRPIDVLVEAIPPADATTDATGNAHPTIAKEALPAEYSALSLVQPGLYHVEITHPQNKIPPRYNTATELGWEIDPSSRTGTSARFDLKSN